MLRHDWAGPPSSHNLNSILSLAIDVVLKSSSGQICTLLLSTSPKFICLPSIKFDQMNAWYPGAWWSLFLFPEMAPALAGCFNRECKKIQLSVILFPKSYGCNKRKDLFQAALACRKKGKTRLLEAIAIASCKIAKRLCSAGAPKKIIEAVGRCMLKQYNDNRPEFDRIIADDDFQNGFLNRSTAKFPP
jgi:hypothetical protein